MRMIRKKKSAVMADLGAFFNAHQLKFAFDECKSDTGVRIRVVRFFCSRSHRAPRIDYGRLEAVTVCELLVVQSGQLQDPDKPLPSKNVIFLEKVVGYIDGQVVSHNEHACLLKDGVPTLYTLLR